MATGHIYFIRCPILGLVKIGHSEDDPVRRFRQVRTISPAPVEPLALMAGSRAEERALHVKFRRTHSHGEWFRESPELLAYVAESAAPWTVRPPKPRRPADPSPRVPARKWAKHVHVRIRGHWKTAAEWAEALKCKRSPRLIRTLFDRGADPEAIFSPGPYFAESHWGRVFPAQWPRMLDKAIRD